MSFPGRSVYDQWCEKKLLQVLEQSSREDKCMMILSWALLHLHNLEWAVGIANIYNEEWIS